MFTETGLFYKKRPRFNYLIFLIELPIRNKLLMRSLIKKHLLRSCMLLIIMLICNSIAYTQETDKEKEINEAITNVDNGNYKDAILVLKKYAEMKGFDDFKTLEINVYLNTCYLKTNDKLLDVDKINLLTDEYLGKYGISKTDTTRSADEATLLYYDGIINDQVGNTEKMVHYFSLIDEYYKLNDLSPDKSYSYVVYMLAQGYFHLKDYQTAIKIGEEAWKINQKVSGEDNKRALNILNILAFSYQNIGKPELSIAYLEKRVLIGKKVLGEKDPDYLMSLNNLALGYSFVGAYQKSLEINLMAVELRREVLGEKNRDYLTSLNNLALQYTNLGDYKKALEINLKVVELRKEILGEKHPGYVTSLNNLAGTYLNLGEYKKALEIILKAVEINKEILDEKNPEYLTSLNNLAQVYSYLGEYSKALEIQLKVVESEKEILGERHPSYLHSLNNLALIYTELGDYQNALEINLLVVELKKEILGEKHPDYLFSLTTLALVYSGLGDTKKALGIDLKVVELEKEVLGENHPKYLISLDNLAKTYSNLGDFNKALEVNLKVIELGKDIWGEKHPDYLISLNNLAQVYHYLGDNQKSIEICLKVVELRKEVLGERHPSYLTSLNDLAAYYACLGNYQKALNINNNVLELRKQVLGEKAPDYTQSLSNQAMYNLDLGKYQEALKFNLAAIEIDKEILSEKHPAYIRHLNNLAGIYTEQGEFKKALEINIQVIELYKEVLDEKDPDYALYMKNLAKTELKLSQNNSALSHFLEMLYITQERVNEYFGIMTENQRAIYWKQFSRDFKLFPLFLEKEYNAQPERAGDGYNIALFTKGLLLNTTIDFDNLIAEKGTPDVISKFEELKVLKLEIQRLTEKPIAERYLNVDSLENIAQQKETEMVKLSKEYGDYTSNLKINWKDVQANLKDNDVAIEFVEYPTLTDTVKYAALVLRKGWQYPRMIPLFRKDQIDEFIKLDKNTIYSKGHVGNEIKKLIWEPLEQVVSLGEHVYFSPAGIIHQLAIENLPFDDSTTLGDRYQMYRLSTTKELTLHKAEEKNKIAVLYGGLQYDLPEEKMMAESKKYEKPGNLYAMRGYKNDTAVRSGWQFLDGTKPEVDKISQLMIEKNYQVKEYTGETGNEESFKSLSGKKEGIIHIATHGFFLPIEESRKNVFMMQRIGDQQQEKATVDPMLRSGLILAGGNKAWQGEKIPENIEDGVLTAREISRMDLRGTDLVVLSACETGLGDVSSEGVFGLQRSFKQAGVQTLVMSLWQVNDEATRYLMTEFYSELLSGKDKRGAFLEAKQKCKVKYPEPRYWAAFIMLD